jgi:folate-binding protein YgfZ
MYSISEYRAVRGRAGLIERFDRGTIKVVGSDRYTWLQGMVSNDVRRLESGESVIQACMLNATGHLIADLSIVRADDFLLLDVPRQTERKVFDTLDQFLIVEDVALETGLYTAYSLQGPVSESVLACMDLTSEALVVPADHTGEGGFDLYLPAEESGIPGGIAVISSKTAEVLRIEAGIPKFGGDMDETTIPLEAGLGESHISHTKGCYVGQEIIHRIYSRGHTNRELAGLVMSGNSIPSRAEKLRLSGAEPGKEVGWITSAAESPAKGSIIALGYVRHEHRTPGVELVTESGINSVVHELPFYRRPQA